MIPLEIVFLTITILLTAFYATYYGLMVYQCRKPSKIKKQRIYPTISLIICTNNDEDTIREKLTNTKELDYPKELLQVLVVDSASTDNTRHLVEDFIQKNSDLHVQLITQPARMGKAAALNYSRQYCNGEIVVISDSDSLLEKDAITQLVANFADPHVGATTGRQILFNPSQSLATKIEQSYRKIYEIIRTGESHLDSTPIFHGELSAFRRNLVEPVASDSVAEDSELALRIRRKGYLTVYDPEAKFYEYAPPSLGARLKQKQRRGQGLVQQFIRFRSMIFNPRYGDFGLIILPSEFFMHTASPILLTVFIATSLILIGTNSLAVGFLVPLVILASAFITLLIASKSLLPSKALGGNILRFMASFLNSQLCLIAGMFKLITRGNQKSWDQIEDTRLLWNLRFRQAYGQEKLKRTHITIGICAYNEAKNIGRLLSALLQQDIFKLCNMEIVVVASGCTDNTAEVVRQFQGYNPSVKLIVEDERKGKAAAINLLSESVESDIFIMEGADTLPKPGCINKLIEPFQDPTVGATSSHSTPINDIHTLWGYAAHYVWNLHHQICLHRCKLSGELLAVRRGTIPKIPRNVINDDMYIELALREKGYKIVYVPEAVVLNKGSTNLRDFLMQRKRIFAGHLQVKNSVGIFVPTSSPNVVIPFILQNPPRGIRQAVWLGIILLMELIAHILARLDLIRGKLPYRWSMCTSTKILGEKSVLLAAR